MFNQNQNLFLIVSDCLASLQKFLKVWSVGVAHLQSAARALAFKSESVFSIVNKSWQRFFSLSFVLRCYNNFHQRQNATNISVFLSHSETLQYENKLAKEFW